MNALLASIRDIPTPPGGGAQHAQISAEEASTSAEAQELKWAWIVCQTARRPGWLNMSEEGGEGPDPPRTRQDRTETCTPNVKESMEELGAGKWPNRIHNFFFFFYNFSKVTLSDAWRRFCRQVKVEAENPVWRLIMVVKEMMVVWTKGDGGGARE